VSLTKLFSTKISCFFCGIKVKSKKAFTAEVNTSEGQLDVKMCPKCAKEFDSLMAQIEEVKNEGSEPI